MIKQNLLAAVSLAVLCSCADTGSNSSGAFGPDTMSRGQEASSPSGFGSRLFGRDRSAVSRGSDQFHNSDELSVGRATRTEINIVDDHLVEITLLNASIEAAADAVLGGVLGKSFVIADGVTGSITIQSTGAIPKTALLSLFETSLIANGARIEFKDNLASISKGAVGNRNFRSTSESNIDGSTIIVAPLKFISANQMLKLLEPLKADGLNAIPDQNRNLMLLSGPATALEAAIDALNLFDVDVMRGKSIALFSLQAAAPDDIVEELLTIFESQEGGMLDGVIDFVPNNRLNSVLVVTSRSQYIDQAQRWIKEFDRSAGRSKRYTHIYPMNNRRASEIAPILNGLISGDDVQSEDGATQQKSRIAADPDRNSLVVRGLQAEHDEIARLLVDLDSRARQVALEATIAEVTLNDEVSLGVRWFMENNRRTTGFSDATSGGVSQNFPGFSSLFSAGNSQLVLNALAGVTDVQVISSPTLVVLDNKEAILQIGDQVPVATQTSSSSDGENAPVITSIDYRDTGVILKVLPQIGAGGTLTLEVSQEVSSVTTTNTSGIDSPTIRQRQISTSVLLNDGATLILGGLVQENNNRTETKVPGLGDVPFLGAAFRNRASNKDRTELLIMIRPRIIRSDSDASAYTAEWRSKLSGANGITSTGLGAPQHSLDEILR